MKFYFSDGSPPCVSVLFFMHTINLQMEMIPLDLYHGEQMTPDFLKINPLHTVPTIEDGEFVLYESRAILGYLADTHAPDAGYYPKDPKGLAVLNQRLAFDLSGLFGIMEKELLMPMLSNGKIDKEKMSASVKTAFTYLNNLLGDTSYIAADKMTIADFSFMASVSVLKDIANMDISEFQNLQQWYERCSNEITDFESLHEKMMTHTRDYIGQSPAS